MDISGRRTREPSVRSLSTDRLLADAHNNAARERNKTISDRINYRMLARQSSTSPTRPDRYSSHARKSESSKRVLRLDTHGRERERRKVSNRENYVDTGPSPTHMEDQVYEYDSCSENTVHYLNDAEPDPVKLERSPNRKSHRCVDTIIPTVPRLDLPSNGLNGSLESRDEKGMKYEGPSPPSSGRSEKLQRTLKNISLNEREPFPGVRARIAKQREREQRSRSHDQAVSQSVNSNNNAAGETGKTEPAKLAKPSHAEEDAVHLNSSLESIIVRPIKRKVATAPEVPNKTRAPVKRPSAKPTVPSSAGARSKSAESTRPNTAKWVDKTPGKGRSMSSGRGGGRKVSQEVIRPDSWRKGMAIVRREMKQRPAPVVTRDGSDNSQPSTARSEKSVRSTQTGEHFSIGGPSQLPSAAHQVLMELRDSDVEPEPHVEALHSRPQTRSTRPKRPLAKPVEHEVVESFPKQRHYDSEAVKQFMKKKRQEKRQQELEERRRREEEERARKEKLKMLQDRSRRVVSHKYTKPSAIVAPAPRDSTFTAGLAPNLHMAPTVDGVWTPVVNSTSYTVATGTAPARRVKSPEQHVISETEEDTDKEDEEGEADTTLTEADLRAETPTKQHSRPSSKSSTPRSVRNSPLLARTRAVEEEIEQLVQAAKQRNQSARQIQAQATPLKQIDQLGSSDATTTTTSEIRRISPPLQQRTKSARITSLAQTTAQLMAKMSMLQADLENSMSRSNSRLGSNYGGALNNSFSPRDVAAPPVQRLSYGYNPREPVREETETESVTEDYSIPSIRGDTTSSHSTVTSEGEPSEDESELSSLDLRIREALSRPSKFVSAYTRPQATSPKELVKPVAKQVSRALAFEERGDGHSVINTYLRKLKADREALSTPDSSRSTPSTCSTSTCAAMPVKCTSVYTMTAPTLTTLSSTGIQTDTPTTTHSETSMSAKPISIQTPAASVIHEQVHPKTTTSSFLSNPLTSPTRQHDITIQPSTHYPLNRSSQVPAPAFTHTTTATQSSFSQPTVSQSRAPPAYMSSTRSGSSAQDRRISPAGLELALSTGISMLEGLNQQQVQLSDVERTRFSTLAQQETVALAQILKGNKERQEQQMLDLRHRIKQEELEAEKKLAEFKREAELANKRREEVERQSEKESFKISTEATQRVLEAQKESTKAFTEAARILEERRERLANTEAHLANSTQTVVESIRMQNEAVAASLTTLVDQQRQQNMEMLRMARREPQLVQNGQSGEGWSSPRRLSSRSPRDRKSSRAEKHQEASRSPRDFAQSPRDFSRLSRDVLRSPKDSARSSRDSSKSSEELSVSTRDSTRSPRESTRSPRETAKSSRESSRSPRESVKSPRGSKSPRSRKLRSPKDRQFQAISERSDLSSRSSRGSDETIQTASMASYSNDFASDKSSLGESSSPHDSPQLVGSQSTVSNGVVRRVLESTDSSIPTDIDSAPSPIKVNSHTESITDAHSHTQSSRSTVKELPLPGSSSSAGIISTQSSSMLRGDDRTRYSESSQSASSSPSTSGDTSLHKVVLGAVKEVFKDAAPAQLRSEQFIDKLKSVLYTLKEGGVTPTALSTPSKHSPISSPTKPPMVAPLSPRIDKRLSVRRPGGQRSSHFAVDSESDESQSFQETASDTDQECQLSALRHHLEETKRRHAMMKKARQHELQRKQNAYKKQIEYYEEDMERMKKEMDDLAALQMASSSATTTSQTTRPQIKQPRAPSSSGSESGRQRHSSGASDAEVFAPQPSVIQKPLVGKSLGQLSSGRISNERRRSDSGQSADSEMDRQREKTPEYGDDFDSDSRAKASPKSSLDGLQTPEAKEVSAARTPDTDADNTYSNGFEDSMRSTDSISESIANSISESLQSSRRPSEGTLSQASDLLRLDELPSGHTASAQASPEKTDFLEEPSLLDLSSDLLTRPEIVALPAAENGELVEGMRSRSLSAASSHTITEAKSPSATPTGVESRSRSPSPVSKSHSRSASPSLRSRSPSDRSRSFSDKSRSPREILSSFTDRSRSPEFRSRSPSDRSRSRTERSRSRSPADRSMSPTDRSSSLSNRSRSFTDRSKSPADRSQSLTDRSRSPTDRSRSPTDRSKASSAGTRHSRLESRKSISRTPSQSSRSRSPSPTISEASIASEVASVMESEKGTVGEEAPLLDLGDSPELATPVPETEIPKTDFEDVGKSGSEPPAEEVTSGLVDVIEEVTPRPSDLLGSSQVSYASEFEDAHSEKSASTVTNDEKEEEAFQQADQSPVVQDPFDLATLASQTHGHEVRQAEKSATEEDESIIDDLLFSAPESSLHEVPHMSLKDELLAALELSSSSAKVDLDEEKISDVEPEDRLAESTPRLNDSTPRLNDSTPRLNDSDAEAREQRDFEEMEKLVKEAASTESSADSSRISFDSKSPDFLEFSTKSNDFQQRSEHSSAKEAGNGGERSEEESELEKAISTAAAAVESFADLDIDDMDKTESQADIGVSVIEETTPRSLLSLESSADDLLDDGQTTPKPATSPTSGSADSGEITPRAASPDTPRLETDMSEKSIQEADEHQLDAATADMISKSFDSVLEMWKIRREDFRAEAQTTPSSSGDSSPVVPALALTGSIAPVATASSSTEVSPVKEVASPAETPSSPSKESEDGKKDTSISEDKSSTSTSLLGSLPPLAITPAKTVQLAAAKSPPDSHSSSSSEESMSPQRSPTKLSFVEEARHEQWAQLDKEIDNVFGSSDNDWFDDDLGMGAESKPVSVIPTKEILNRVVVPEPVFVVPHEETEVKTIARCALDIFWQARRCGESWSDLEPTSQYMETKDKLELEASSTVAFKQFMFDLIREMLRDIYQSESGIPINQRVSGGPLNQYFKHRQPPTTLDEVRELIDKQIYPAVTGKLVHPTKSSRVMPASRNKRRDKVDTILIQELREEEASWLYYAEDEVSVKEAVVDDVFKVLLDDSISAVLDTYNVRYGIRPMTEL